MDAMETVAAPLMGTPYSSISRTDLLEAVTRCSNKPLSGYLAGRERGGANVRALEEAWAETFGIKHAIACNSATSGLLAAAFAAGLKPGDKFAVSPISMSATCAAPMFTGAYPVFGDVEDETFSLNNIPPYRNMKAIVATNEYGHPAKLQLLRHVADATGICLIEDNAQSPFAMEGGRYAGTIGHIGVFSLNVHKHFQCGEGGVVVTDDDGFAERMRGFINHGENRQGPIGLNLRMPELCAAVALMQLQRGLALVEERRRQAEAIIAAIGDVPGIRPPVVRNGCTHSFYIIPFLTERRRGPLCSALRAAGVPVVEGCVPPLYRLPVWQSLAAEDDCPVAEALHDHRLFFIENCAHTFSEGEIRRIGDAFRKGAEQCRLT